MSNKEDIRKELEGLSPFLVSIPKKEPYTAPPGYLHKMAAEVAEKVRQQEKVAGLSLWERLVPQFFKIAVVAVILIGVAVVWQQFGQPQQVPQEIAVFTEQDYLEMLDEELLMEFAHAEGVWDANGNIYIDDLHYEDIEDEFLMDEL